MTLFLMLLISIILVTILNLYLHKNFKDKIKFQHYLFGYFFALYLFIALLLAGTPNLSEIKLMQKLNRPMYNPILNYIPLSDGINISTILNIIYFIPFGFLLPTLWQRFRSFIPCICTSLLFSLFIEISQLFNNRATDIDDLIMNTLGAIIGWFIFTVLSKILRKLSNNTMVDIISNKIIVKLEPYMYIIMVTICAFLV